MKKIIVMLVALMATFAMEAVTAKGFSSRSSFSSSRSSFSSSRSYSRPSYSRSSSKPKKSTTSKPAFSTKKSTTSKPVSKFNAKSKSIKTSRFSKSKGFDKNKKNEARKAHTAQVAKFKKPVSKPKLDTKTRSTYSSSSYVKSSYSYNRSTRLNRRSTYYSSYSPPVYVYNSSPSFGMWDSIGLWYMLDHMNDRNQYSMMYHHQNDQGFQEWRREANRLSADNAELRAQLNQLDKNVAGMKGTKINDGYVPEGVDSDILLSDQVANNIKPELKICAGSINGMYSTYAYKMKNILPGFITSIVHTNGSNENINLLENNKCDIAITQRDTYDLWTMCSNSSTNSELNDICKSRGILFNNKTNLNFTRIASPFKDSVIGVCNKDTVFKDAKTFAMVDKGGDVLTFSNLQLELDYLSKVKTISSTSMSNSLALVSSGKADCTLIVANFRAKILAKMNSYQNIHTVNIIDSKIYKITDPAGEKVYEKQQLSVNALGPVSDKHSLGFFKKYMENPKVPVDVIISNKYNSGLASKIKSQISNITL